VYFVLAIVDTHLPIALPGYCGRLIRLGLRALVLSQGPIPWTIAEVSVPAHESAWHEFHSRNGASHCFPVGC
jgi:hypothetical protein